MMNALQRSNMDELPRDIVFNIFGRLPVKSLLKLRLVSKSFSKIIDHPFLANMQMTNSRLDEDIVALIIPDDLFFNGKAMTLYSASEEGTTIRASKTPMIKFEGNGFYSLGSCNGLLYFAEYNRGIVVVSNPPRNQFRVLPPVIQSPRPYLISYGLGFDSSTNTFKMVCTYFQHFKSNMVTVVHTFGTSSWKPIPKVPQYTTRGRPVFVHGFLHWMVDQFINPDDKLSGMVVSFDVTREEFNLISHPEFRSEDWKLFNLFEMNSKLAMVDLSCDKDIEIWVLVDYDKKVWRKEYTIGMTAPLGQVDNRQIEVIGIWKNGEILLKSDGGYWIYSMKTGGLVYKHTSGFDGSASIYTLRGSLISISDGRKF